MVERDLISERTKEGLAAARAKGRLLGRPKGALGTSRLDGKEEEIRILLQKQVSKASIAKIVGVSRTALHPPVRRGFLYLVAIMDWVSRHVLAWRLSNTLDAGFCVEALDEALTRHGQPEVFNTDQGSQFTGFAFTGRLQAAGVRISMDGRGRCLDNIFIERLWRSLKYEAVYLHELTDGFEARRLLLG